MQIKVDKIIDNLDGSATVTFDMDEEALKAMASYGILQALLNSLAELEDTEEVKE